MFIGVPVRKPKQKANSPLSADTFRVLGKKKQHIVPNVSVSFVSSADLIPLGSSVADGSKRLCVHVSHVLL